MPDVGIEASSSSAAADAARRHLLIAGTGRAGTSFLVRYLAGLGLDTHLARYGDAAFWDAEANAGLEDPPVAVPWPAALPYVVKSPWLHEHIDEILDCTTIKLDAVIVPVRPLDEAAASRIVVELRAIHERVPSMAELRRSWQHRSGAVGGGVFSLHPLDQARVLAVGFHHLVERLVRADVPLVLLDFPRLVLDAEYVFAKLAPLLPLAPTVDAARAREVHRSLADAGKVRIGAELAEAGRRGTGDPGDAGEPSLATLDQIAIRRELSRLRAELAATAADNKRLRADLGEASETVTSRNLDVRR